MVNNVFKLPLGQSVAIPLGRYGADRIQEAINYAASVGLPLDLQGRTWVVNSDLTFPSNLYMRNGTIDNRGQNKAGGNNHFAIRALGSVSPYVLLNADVAPDAPPPHAVTLAAGGVITLGGLGVDDVLFFHAPLNFFYVNHPFDTSKQAAGELATVLTVSGTTVGLTAPLAYGYTVANEARVQKITPARNIRLENITFLGPYTNGFEATVGCGGLDMTFVRDCRIENCRFYNYNNCMLRLQFAMDCRITNCEFRDSPGAYGVCVAFACRGNVIDHNWFYNNRHGVTLSSGPTPQAGLTGSAAHGTCRSTKIHFNYLEGRDAAIDSHGSADDTDIHGNTIVVMGDLVNDLTRNGITYEGKNVFITNNRFKGNMSSAVKYQPAAEASFGYARAVITGNHAEAVSLKAATINYCYYILTRTLAVGIDHLIIDNTADGPWHSGVFITSQSELPISGVTVRGSYKGMLTSCVGLDADVSDIADVTIDVRAVGADAATTYGVLVQPPPGGKINAVIRGTFSGVVTAIRRAGSVGTATVRADMQLAPDVANAHASFLAADTVFVNGTGVKTITSARTLTSADSGMSFNNTGTTARVDFQLPTGVPGLRYTFHVLDTDGIRVIAGAAPARIYDGTTASAQAGRIDSTALGSTLTIECTHSAYWFVVAKTGTWTVT